MKDEFDFEDESADDFMKRIKEKWQKNKELFQLERKTKKKRLTKEERERKLAIARINRENKKSFKRDSFSTLDGLRNEIYTLIYNYDILNFKSNLKTLDEICENEDIYTLERIIKDSSELIELYKKSLKENDEIYEIKDLKIIRNITKKAFKEIELYQYKQAIIKFIGSSGKIVLDCLECISTVEESDIVYEALIGTEHITLLPKGYAKAKEYKIKYRNKKYRPLTYELALRRNRRILEKDLNEIGVGQQKAKKISKLFEYL